MTTLRLPPRRAGAFALALAALAGCAGQDGDETEIDPSELAAETGASTVIFSDDFESGELASPRWTAVDDVQVLADAAKGEGSGVRVGRASSLTASFDTLGKRNVTLSFDLRTRELERSEYLSVSWALPGRPFIPLTRVSGADWQSQKVTLPALAANRVGVLVRFTLRASKAYGRTDTDAVDLDNVVVAGSALGSSDGGVDAGPSTDGGGAGPVVKVADGALRGKVSGAAEAFLGIPYAKPPVGALRFAPAQPAEPWTGVREATAFGASCPQNPGGLSAPPPLSEDCLTLNVYRPAQASSAKLPVMVWIHGGALVAGGSVQYDGSRLAAEGPVVVVSVNYRLGVLGLLSHPALDGERGALPSGNDAFRDQQLALTWVKNNIAAFGGDPANVTVVGESAGAMSTCIQLVSPTSRTLGKRFILESGTCVGGLPVSTKEQANAVGTGLAQALCPEATDVVACLREKSVEELVAYGADRGISGAGWAPVVNPADPLLPKQPAALIASGDYNKGEIIVGSNKNEWGLFLNLPGSAVPLTTVAEYNAAVQAQFGAATPLITAQYPATDATARGQFITLMTDALFRCPARTLARLATKSGSKVHLYSFEEGPSFHAFEIPYVFGNPSPNLGAPTLVEPLRATVQSYWRQFARTGDPNVEGQPTWPTYDATSDQHITLKATSEVGQNLQKANCDFWELLLSRAPG